MKKLLFVLFSAALFSAAPLVAQTYVNGTWIFEQGTNAFVDTGSANAYVLSYSPSAYAKPFNFCFLPAHSNSGASTLAFGMISAIAIQKNGGTALSGGEIIANQPACGMYDGTYFQLQGGAGSSSSGLVVGSTTISSGTSGSIEYNNNGTLGEYGLGFGLMTAAGNIAVETASITSVANNQSGVQLNCSDTNGTTNWTCSLAATGSAALGAYTDGMVVHFRTTTASNTTASLNIDSLGNKTVYYSDCSTQIGTNIAAGQTYNLSYSSAAGGFCLFGIGNAVTTLHSNFTNSNATFTTVGDGTRTWSWGVAANSDYKLDCTFYYEGATATTNDPTIQITGPSSPTAVSYGVDGYNGTTFVSATAQAFSTSLDPFSTLASDTVVYMAHIYMSLANGANAGTIAVQAKNTTGTDVMTIYGGSACTFQ